ncbi:hypothetical protein [Cerasicoccus maritimus]|uniref:hypothetical protein n=1 Tax=Cerasicoccus maritimus TaxID=490089 RepID=UPI0028528FA6|nr:hypothetical protein [Cerasicoccus maritimus]
MPSYSESEESSITLQLLSAGALSALFIVLNLIGLGFTALKETPEFWTNGGGYPIWLRETVLESYYPGLIAVFLIQTLATIACIYTFFKHGSGAALLGLLGLAPPWLMFLVTVGVLIANNIWNLINNNPLHWHPG